MRAITVRLHAAGGVVAVRTRSPRRPPPVAPAREVKQVGVLVVGQPQGARDRVQDFRRHLLIVALLQTGVVGDGHPGELDELLATQPRNPAVAA